MALAAVGSCGTLMFLILGFLVGLTAGFTVVTAQHYGAGNLKAVRQSVVSGAVLSGIVSVVLTVASMLLMNIFPIKIGIVKLKIAFEGLPVVISLSMYILLLFMF